MKKVAFFCTLVLFSRSTSISRCPPFPAFPKNIVANKVKKYVTKYYL